MKRLDIPLGKNELHWIELQKEMAKQPFVKLEYHKPITQRLSTAEEDKENYMIGEGPLADAEMASEFEGLHRSENDRSYFDKGNK